MCAPAQIQAFLDGSVGLETLIDVFLLEAIGKAHIELVRFGQGGWS